MSIKIKKSLPYIGTIIFFLLLSLVYFLPDIAEGKILFQGDMQQGIAVGQEGLQFRNETGETTRWTNSLFGGMPNYQISPSYAPAKVINFLQDCYRLWLPSPASLIFIMLVGFFILMLSLKTKWYIAALGAIAYAFSSYFFIIIGAGHIWKFVTLAYIPPTIAGIILAYRGKYLAGGVLAAWFAALQISSNHIQMSYYFLFVIVAIVIAFFVQGYKEKQLPVFFKATATLIVSAIIAIAVNLPNLYNTYEYSKESMRGGTSELKSDSKASQNGGLDKNYITGWSYGIGETWTLLIPDTKGGATGYLGKDKEVLNDVNPDYKKIVAEQNRYWGDQPFTAGPVYVGAFIVFLFILGCFIVKGPLKWGLLAATILSVLLSWGRNFMPLTDFFIDYFPLYNKFRTVSSILVIAEFCIPVLAMLALKEILEKPEIIKEKSKAFIASFALTGGITLLFAIMPTLFFSFLSNQESSVFLPLIQQNEQYRELQNSIEGVRQSLFTADAWRSFFIITIGAIITALFAYRKLGKNLFIAFISILILCDMFTINKRYLNSDNFVEKTRLKNPFPKSPADEAILKDKDPNFRVLNTTTDTFNDAITSYYHKSVGGYHAAKLRRYQDLIEHQLSNGNQNVFNMLNTKYIIVKGQNGQPIAQRNPYALGNAWFVSDIKWVQNADEEMNALNSFNPLETAVIDQRFKETLKEIPAITKTAGDTINLISYKPNELIYKSTSTTGGFGVFSEIYYPHGWKITIDGKPAKEVRTDYVLRGLYIPAGNHEIVFRFDPDSVRITEYISFAALGLLFIGVIIYIIRRFSKRKECDE